MKPLGTFLYSRKWRRARLYSIRLGVNVGKSVTQWWFNEYQSRHWLSRSKRVGRRIIIIIGDDSEGASRINRLVWVTSDYLGEEVFYSSTPDSWYPDAWDISSHRQISLESKSCYSLHHFSFPFFNPNSIKRRMLIGF